MTQDTDRLLKVLGASDDKLFKLMVLETLGELVLCIHWLRGTFNWMFHTGVVKFASEDDRKNYERLFNNVALYESFVWEYAPSRVTVLIIQEYLKSGELPKQADLEEAVKQDAHGRIPEGTQPHNLDDIQDLIRRLGAARVERLKNETIY